MNNNCISTNIALSVYQDIQSIRNKAPLIHNITNFVVMQQTANALLALGASPIMAHAEEELSDIMQIANSLVVNIGTLDSLWISAMHQAMRLACLRDIPIILDPVGVGATKFRTQTIRQLLKTAPPSVIRGNASEILALYAQENTTKGVDSTHSSEQSLQAATHLVKINNCVVVVSGAVDICLAKNNQIKIYNGVPLMTKVTGMGCTASALIAAFCAVNPDVFSASIHAMITMGIAGEIAAKKAFGPGSFSAHFCDALYNMTEKDIVKKISVEEKI